MCSRLTHRFWSQVFGRQCGDRLIDKIRSTLPYKFLLKFDFAPSFCVNRVFMPMKCLFLKGTRRTVLYPNQYCNKSHELVKCFRNYVHTSFISRRERSPFPLQKSKFTSFVWQYILNHEPPLHVQTYISDSYHVLHHKYKRKYERRPRDTLWWTASTGMATSNKSVVRHYCSRKMRNAFINALKIRGYDKDGRIPSSEEFPNGRDGILGSARFGCLKPMITIDAAALDEECLAIVDNIILLNRHGQTQKSKNARSASSAMPFRSNLFL